MSNLKEQRQKYLTLKAEEFQLNTSYTACSDPKPTENGHLSYDLPESLLCDLEEALVPFCCFFSKGDDDDDDDDGRVPDR